jgi:hypothetical protein
MRRFFPLLLVVLMLAACAHRQSVDVSGRASITGVVMADENRAPIEGAFVYAYRDSTTHFFGPPHYLSSPTGPTGMYELQLPPGRYFLFARKRASGSYQGPLQKEDLSTDTQPITVTAVASGTATMNFFLQKIEGQQFYRPEKFYTVTDTSVAGRILDGAGKPVFGAFAFAYRDQFQKSIPPNYGSLATEQDGRYILYLDTGGSFVIGGRMQPKEPPLAGEPVGFWQDNPGRPVTVSKGERVADIDIVLRPFTGSSGVKPSSKP